MKKLLIAAALCWGVVTSSASFAETKAQGSGPNPYTECGIGAALFPDLHWAAVISNATWDLGSTAITSALTTPETCNAKKVKTATLILETLPQLEKDLAKGEGAFVVALADTMGCDASTITSAMRATYGQNVADLDYVQETTVQRANAMYNSARDAAAKAGCSVTL